LVWSVLALALIFYGVFIVRTGITADGRVYFPLFDDAMVSMRYARNLAEGNGLIWNLDGQAVEGYSNFLWTLWMSFLHLVPISDGMTQLLIMASGAVLLVATALVVGRIAAMLAPDTPWVAPVAVALTAFYYPLAFWTLRGMETGLVALIVAGCVLVALRLRERFELRWLWALGGLMAVGVLTRDDVVVPCLVVGAFTLISARREHRRPIAMIVGGLFLAAILGHTAFRLAYYGEALPNTYFLKATGMSLETRLVRGVAAFGYMSVTHLFAPLLLAVAFFAARRRAAPGALLLAAVFVAQCAYSVYVGGDAWEEIRYANRYIAPIVPFLLVLALLGIREVVTATPVRRRRLTLALAGAFGVVAAAALLIPSRIDLLNVALGPRPVGTAARAVGVAAILILVLAAVGRRGSSVRSLSVLRAPTAAAVVIAVVAFGAINAAPLKVWAQQNALGASLDAQFTRYALALRDATAPEAMIAVHSAGAIPYLSERDAVDLLGKVDPKVAHGPPKPVPFRPGHNKWDYMHSIGDLRPDVVAQLWIRSDRDLCALRGWGYRQIAPDVWVNDRARVVDEVSLARAVSNLGLDTYGSTVPADCAARPGLGPAIGG